MDTILQEIDCGEIVGVCPTPRRSQRRSALESFQAVEQLPACPIDQPDVNDCGHRLSPVRRCHQELLKEVAALVFAE